MTKSTEKYLQELIEIKEAEISSNFKRLDAIMEMLKELNKEFDERKERYNRLINEVDELKRMVDDRRENFVVRGSDILQVINRSKL